MLYSLIDLKETVTHEGLSVWMYNKLTFSVLGQFWLYYRPLFLKSAGIKNFSLATLSVPMNDFGSNLTNDRPQCVFRIYLL